MKNLFSFALYKQGLKRVCALAIGFLVSMAVLNLIGTQTISRDIQWEIELSLNLGRTVNIEDIMPYSLILVFFAPILTYNMFSFINDRPSADYYHSLPQKRSTVFVSFMAAAFTWLVGMVFISGAVSYFGWEVIRGADIFLVGFVKNLICYSVLALMLSACTAFAMMFTGTALSAVYAASAIIWLPAVVMLLFQLGVTTLYPQIIEARSAFDYIGAGQFLPGRLFGNINGYQLNGGLLISVLVSLALVALAGVAYSKRRSEIATHSTAGGIARHIIRGALAFLLAAVAFYGFFVEDIFNGVAFLLISLLAYFLYELIVSKSIKGTLKALPWFLTVLLAAGAFVGAIHLTAYSLEKAVPETAKEVESISVYNDTYFTYAPEIEKALKDVEIRDEAVINAVLDDFFNNEDEDNVYLYDHLRGGVSGLKIRLKNGKTLWRRFEINSSYQALGEYICATPSLNEKFYALPTLSLTEWSDSEIWESFKAEYKTTDFNSRLLTNQGNTYTKDRLIYKVSFDQEDSEYDISRTYYVYPDIMPKTYKLLKEKGVE